VLAAPHAAQRLGGLGSTAQMRIGNVNLGTNAKARDFGAATGRAIAKRLIK
jgi:hypothetical protein